MKGQTRSTRVVQGSPTEDLLKAASLLKDWTSTAGKAFYRAQEREVAVQRLPEQKNDGRAAVVQTSTAQRDERQAG